MNKKDFRSLFKRKIKKTAIFYQTEHFLFGLFLDPDLQLNALAKSSIFDVAPITLWKLCDQVITDLKVSIEMKK